MSLNIAVQMDPMESINIAGDSTFAIMLGAQARGHRLFHYLAPRPELCRRPGHGARPAPVDGAARRTAIISARRPGTLDLADDVDVVLMRQDPPFDLGYITATHLLERIQPQTLVVNDPAAVRNAPEKVFVLDFARFMPPTLITRSLGRDPRVPGRAWRDRGQAAHGNAGKAVFKVGRDGANLAALTELFNTVWREPHMVQAFLPEVARGRQAHRADRRQGGRRGQPHPGRGRDPLQPRRRRQARRRPSSPPRESEICDALGPELARSAGCCSSAST